MKNPDISDRLSFVPSSPIRKLVPFAQIAEKQGVKVYHLNIGDPDIPTPSVMLEVLRNWRINPIGYDQSQGNHEFIEALMHYYHSFKYKFIKSQAYDSIVLII